MPLGAVARNAAEAWPDRPAGVPSITPEDIARACVTLSACASSTTDSPVLGMNFCVANVEWSAERAIAMSSLMKGYERAEFLVSCVLSASSCTEANQCFTGRDQAIICEEDGCRVNTGEHFTVTCDGTVATMVAGDHTIVRDCARAYAECDPASETGCTDRPFSACPADGDTADHCDGNVLLGCDKSGQVTYHDCERMSGVCGMSAAGTPACIYGVSDSECTSDPPQLAACVGTDMAVCVAGQRVQVPAPELCPGP